MRILLLLICIASQYDTIAQEGSYRFEDEEKTCAATGELYNGIANWEIFQTDNDLISGNRTIICAEKLSPNLLVISNIAEGHPIFIESVEPLDIDIAADNIYNINTSIRASQDLICDCITECNQPICNEVNLIIKGEIGGSDYRDTFNIMVIETSSNNVNEEDFINFQSCFVTPSFENPAIDKITFTIFPEKTDAIEFVRIDNIEYRQVEFSSFYLENATFVNHIVPDFFRAGISYSVGPTFFTMTQDVFDFGHVKVLNPNPLNDELFYYDITPEDSTQQKIINIINTPFTQLIFQRDAQIRGALVSAPNNDTLRHRVNLINDGANVCMPPFIELIMGGEDEFRYRSGTLDFANDWSCMQFRENAKLVVEKDAHLHYGNNGIGLLSLRPGASIVIEDNASLYFDGGILMPDNNEYPITVTLGPNQSLTFSDHSFLRTFQPKAKLTIYMEGGQLDISDLRSEYHQYLDIIYPEVPESLGAELIIYPNPTLGEFTIYVPEENLSSTAILYDQYGRKVIHEIILKDRMTNVNVSGMDRGVYFLRHSTGAVSKLIVK